MRKTTAEEIASVSGINEKLAGEIVHFLKTH
jgi:ERCC4-type nuclease